MSGAVVLYIAGCVAGAVVLFPLALSARNPVLFAQSLTCAVACVLAATIMFANAVTAEKASSERGRAMLSKLYAPVKPCPSYYKLERTGKLDERTCRPLQVDLRPGDREPGRARFVFEGNPVEPGPLDSFAQITDDVCTRFRTTPHAEINAACATPSDTAGAR